MNSPTKKAEKKNHSQQIKSRSEFSDKTKVETETARDGNKTADSSPIKTAEMIKKGCGKEFNIDNSEKICGRMLLCPTCRAKLQATRETARLMIDDEIEFLEKSYDILCFVGRDQPKINDCRNCDKKFRSLCKKTAFRLQALQKQKEELK